MRYGCVFSVIGCLVRVCGIWCGRGVLWVGWLVIFDVFVSGFFWVCVLVIVGGVGW